MTISRSSTHTYLWVALSLFIFLGNACKSKKVLVDNTVEEEALTAEGLLETVARNQLQAQSFDGSAKVDVKSDALSIGVTATIRMKKDETIWMSVRKFGFEMGRAMVTKDSIYILNRLANEYAVEPLSYIEKSFRLPANLEMLQQLLLGNPVYLTTANPKAQLQEDGYRLSANSGAATNDFWFSSPDFHLQRMAYEQSDEGRSLKVDYDSYQPAGANRDFSYLRNIEVDSRETGAAQITLTFSKVEINQAVDIKFSIPPRYKRASY